MLRIFLKILFPVLFFSLIHFRADGQCCAGGGGTCIAGGASEGVLQFRQVELNTNFQFISTHKFYNGDSPADKGSFDSFKSQYEYFRLAYGVSKNLTFSVESGYYLLKKEVGLNSNPATTYTSKGIGDLVVFPRYEILNYRNDRSANEITIGLGYKLPLGSYNDSAANKIGRAHV